MNRLLYIIGQIDQALGGHYYNGTVFEGLCEQEYSNGERIIVSYSNGDFSWAGFNGDNGLNIYHRLIDITDDESEEDGFGRNTLRTDVYNMVMVGFGSQSDISSANVNINYKIADEFKKLFPNRLTGVQLANLDAQSAIIKTTGVINDRKRVFAQELPDTAIVLNPDNVLFQVNYTITVKYLDSCVELACIGYEPLIDLTNLSCENINDTTWGISQDKFDECGLDRFCPEAPTLSAAFSADNTTPSQGDTVTFTDSSTGSPTSWCWDFGDGSGSTLQNPTHIFETAGTYTVTLMVSKSGSIGDVEVKTNYITVTAVAVTDGLLQRFDGQNYVLGTGSNISQWTDLSGKGNHASQPNAARQPDVNSGALNSLDVINFDSEYFRFNRITLPTWRTLMLVIQVNSSASNQNIEYWPISDASQSTYAIANFLTSGSLLQVGTIESVEFSRYSFTTGTWYVITLLNNNDDDAVYYDNSLQTESSNVAKSDNTSTGTYCFIGSGQRGDDGGTPSGGCVNVNIAERWLWYRRLTTTEQANMYSFFQNKYAL